MMNAYEAFHAVQKPRFPRVLVSTRHLFSDEDILLLNVRERTLSRAQFLVVLAGEKETRLYRLIYTLILRAPQVISLEKLIEFVWPNCVDGGPLYAAESITQVVHKIKRGRYLDALGIEITSAYGRGYAMNEKNSVQVAA
jgi:DNA-binding winged helix-turn-helix (wHTH) protein